MFLFHNFTTENGFALSKKENEEKQEGVHNINNERL